MDDIIDYARPTMLAERALKDMHNAMLEKRYDDAVSHLMEASVQLADAFKAVVVERENAGKAQNRS